MMTFPNIDIKATGANINRLRKERGYTVRMLQNELNLAVPVAIYHWEAGINLPSVDNLYLLAGFFGVKIDDILIPCSFGGHQDKLSGGPLIGFRLFPGFLWLAAA